MLLLIHLNLGSYKEIMNNRIKLSGCLKKIRTCGKRSK